MTTTPAKSIDSAGPARVSRPVIDGLREAGVLSPLDHRFAERLAALFGESREASQWAAALACRMEAEGHVCADLPALLASGLVIEGETESRHVSVLQGHDDWLSWREELRQSPLVECLGDPAPEGLRPLVLDGSGRLYLRRAYRSECRLAEQILARAAGMDVGEAASEAEPNAAGEESETDRALRVGLTRPLSIVTGGPGTGKTTLVAGLVRRVIESSLSGSGAVPRIALLAPTGKAAAAMTLAFERLRADAELPPAIAAAFPMQATTIHRALGIGGYPDAFGRMQVRRLEADLVVVDESSMVDLATMEHLFTACEGVERLVLLGDPDQLASVAAGSVLADLCGRTTDRRSPSAEASEGPLEASTARLTISHRFKGEGSIGRLADSIRIGDADLALELLADPARAEISIEPVVSAHDLVARLAEASQTFLESIDEAAGIDGKLETIGRYRVLCAYRRGALGSQVLSARLDDLDLAGFVPESEATSTRARLLLVTRNAPEQDLWNGDVGLVARTDEGARVFFPDGRGGVRRFSTGRLPDHESALAMTVHKSQGSEFDFVDLVLGDRESPLLSRELLYTGVTRARDRLRIHASEAALRSAIERPIERHSGLGERLWGARP